MREIPPSYRPKPGITQWSVTDYNGLSWRPGPMAPPHGRGPRGRGGRGRRGARGGRRGAQPMGGPWARARAHGMGPGIYTYININIYIYIYIYSRHFG